MGLVPFGGFIVATEQSGSYIGRQKVDEGTLRKVADLLGIKTKEFDQIASEVTSVFIYRGTEPTKNNPQPPKKKKKKKKK